MQISYSKMKRREHRKMHILSMTVKMDWVRNFSQQPKDRTMTRFMKSISAVEERDERDGRNSMGFRYWCI